VSSEDRANKRIEDLERRYRVHSQDPEALAVLIQAYTQAGRHLQAADVLEARLKTSSPADWNLVVLICDACRKAGRPERGYDLLRSIHDGQDARSTYWTLRGRMLEEMGDLEKARQEHAKACELDPSDPDALFRCGVTLMKAHLDQEAIRCFTRCLALNPKMTKAQINIGVLLDQSGQSDKAIEAFRAAIESDPTSVESHCNLGAAYGDLGRKKEAVAEFRRALEIDPNYPMAHFNLGVALMESFPEEAMAELKKAQALDPGNWEINYNLGLIYFRKGMYEMAARLLLQCVQARPDSVPALYYLGVTYNKKDQPGLAIEQLSKLLDLDPQNSRAHFYLGVAYDKKGQFDKARACYQAADRLSGGMPGEKDRT
jgi:tetratricopeptide (TPR) repeat protein